MGGGEARGGDGGRALVEQRAAPQQQQRVEARVGGGARLVDGEHDCRAGARVTPQHAHDEQRRRGVEARGRLIEQQHARACDELEPEARAPPLAARDAPAAHPRAADDLVGDAAQVQRAQRGAHELLAPRGGAGGRQAQSGGHVQVLADCERLSQLVILEQVAGRTRVELRLRTAVEEHAAAHHRALPLPAPSGEQREERCLT